MWMHTSKIRIIFRLIGKVILLFQRIQSWTDIFKQIRTEENGEKNDESNEITSLWNLDVFFWKKNSTYYLFSKSTKSSKCKILRALFANSEKMRKIEFENEVNSFEVNICSKLKLFCQYMNLNDRWPPFMFKFPLYYRWNSSILVLQPFHNSSFQFKG